MPLTTMHKRAGSIATQATENTPAAAYVWHPKLFKCHVRSVTEGDAPDLLTYTRALQREADPKTIYMIAEASGLLDAYFGYPLCGVGGQPDTGVWSVGLNDPDWLTVTEAFGGLARQLINGLPTRLVVHNDPASGRMWWEGRIVGTYQADPTIDPEDIIIGTSTVFRAGQCRIKRNGSYIRSLSTNCEFLQQGDPLYTNPDAEPTSPGIPYAQADEIESFGVTAKHDSLWKYLAYAGSSIEAAETFAYEEWIWEATRPDVGTDAFTLTAPKVKPYENPDTNSERPRVRQSSAGPCIANDDGAIVLVEIASGELDYSAG